MWFKVSYSLASMDLAREEDAPVRVPLPNGKKGEVVLWIRTFQPEIKAAPQLCCDAIIERTLKPDVEDMFLSLARRVLPKDNPPVVELPFQLSFEATIDADGNIPDKWLVPLEIMPRKFQALDREVSEELSGIVRTFVKTLRWVQQASGRQSPLAFIGLYWSFDKDTWYHMPHSGSVTVIQHRPIITYSDNLAVPVSVWESGEHEPLGHELVREAFDIALSNPRSSLLISISALETALKSYITFLVPNSELLLEKMPSPPALTMTQEVIPNLHRAMKTENSHFPLNKQDSDFLRKWIVQRNQVAHGVKDRVDTDDLMQFLSFVRTLLYRIDLSRGHTWAEAFIERRDEGLAFEA